MARLIDADALRLMKVEECAGHTIDYAAGWKACIDWVRTLPTVDGWISVKDRLPGEDGRYLVYNMSYCNAVALVTSFSTCLENVEDYAFEGEKRPGWFSYDDEYGYYEIDGVTHWMPLPEPPKEEDDAGQ